MRNFKSLGLVKAAGITGLLILSGTTISMLSSTGLLPKLNSNHIKMVAQNTINNTMIYVNPNGGVDLPSNGTNINAPVKTITYAIQLAQPGTVIQLAPGLYNAQNGEQFPLIVKPGVIIRGEESNKGAMVQIVGGGTYTSPTFAAQSVTMWAGTNSEIAGVSVTNPNTRGTGLWIESSNPIVRNNTFTKSNRDGIFTSGNANPRIESNLFIQNLGNGISIAKQSQGEIRNNVFQKTGMGIAVTETATPLIIENQIIDNTDGVVVSQSARPVLRGNIIERNQRDGIVAISDALPDLGQPNQQGLNRIRNNGELDINNATRANTLTAFGNDLDTKKLSARVSFGGTIPIADGSGGGSNAGGGNTGGSNTNNPPANTLADVKGHWAQNYIEALAQQNIIAGFPDGTFRPNEPVTRAQFAAILDKAFSPKGNRPQVTFKDVTNTFWGNQAIQNSYQGGFLTGYPNGVFKPNQNIPRVEVLVSLASGLQIKSNNVGVLTQYADRTAIPNWAQTAIAGATERQLVVNYPNRAQLNPNTVATRADVAAFVYQAMHNQGKVQAISSPYLMGTR